MRRYRIETVKDDLIEGVWDYQVYMKKNLWSRWKRKGNLFRTMDGAINYVIYLETRNASRA